MTSDKDKLGNNGTSGEDDIKILDADGKVVLDVGASLARYEYMERVVREIQRLCVLEQIKARLQGPSSVDTIMGCFIILCNAALAEPQEGKANV